MRPLPNDPSPEGVRGQVDALCREGRHEDALAACSAALERAQGIPPEQGHRAREALHNLRGDIHRARGRIEEALPDYLAAFEAATAAGDTARAATALRSTGEIALRQRRTEQALEYFSQARARFEQAGDRFQERITACREARASCDAGRSRDARAALDAIAKTLDILEGLTETQRETLWGTYYGCLGYACFKAGDLPEARRHLDRSAVLLDRSPLALIRAETCRLLGIIHSQSREWGDALAHLYRALVSYTEKQYELGRFDAYYSLGTTYLEMGDLHHARLCLNQCVGIAHAAGLSIEAGKTKSKLADIEVRYGRLDRALELYQEDLRATEASGDKQAMGWCHGHIAQVHRLRKEWKEAVSHARLSQQMFLETEREVPRALAELELAECLIAADRMEEASEVIGSAEQTLSGRKMTVEYASVDKLRGMIALRRGDYDQALERLRRSIAVQSKGTPTRQLAETLYEAGIAAKQMSRRTEALRHLRAAVELAAVLGSRDIRTSAIQRVEEIDRLEAQKLLLAPYLPSGAVDDLATGGHDVDLERDKRLCSILFVDMRGYTSMSGKTDLGDLVETVDAFLCTAVRVITQHGGTVDKFIGDCVMAVFGIRTEDDGARQAVAAALDIVEYVNATALIRSQAGVERIAVSVGVNTGEAVAGCFGPLLRRDYTVLGHHVNLAARLQSLVSVVDGEQNSRIVISGDTYGAARDLVAAERIPEDKIAMKGIDSSSVAVYLVTGRAEA